MESCQPIIGPSGLWERKALTGPRLARPISRRQRRCPKRPRPVAEVEPDPCECGGQCLPCHLDSLQKQILEVDKIQSALLAQLGAVLESRKLAVRAFRAGLGYTPQASLETAEREVRQQLTQLVAERQRLLREFCRLDPTSPLCREETGCPSPA
jgi:hypothetical protein